MYFHVFFIYVHVFSSCWSSERVRRQLRLRVLTAKASLRLKRWRERGNEHLEVGSSVDSKQKICSNCNELE